MKRVAQLIELRRRCAHGAGPEFERRLQAYYLECCRRIWPLLPQEASRAGVEAAECYLRGEVSTEELWRSEWLAEGAALAIDTHHEPESIRRWVADVCAIDSADLYSVVGARRPMNEKYALKLLLDAAFFAEFAIGYSRMQGHRPLRSYEKFLSEALFAEHFGESPTKQGS